MFRPNRKDVDMLVKILIAVGILAALIGVILIYDARPITKKLFGFGDQNEAAAGLKITGFALVVIGGFLIFFNI